LIVVGVNGTAESRLPTERNEAMTKYVLLTKGGSMPQTKGAVGKMMAEWDEWIQGLGTALTGQGNPLGASFTINRDGSTEQGGGTDPATGYMVIDADWLTGAVALTAPPEYDGRIVLAEAVGM
jgi:hypothetical protein